MAEKMDNDVRIKDDACKRCNDQKKVNRFGLCKSCEDQVDEEYYTLFRISEMEH